MTFDSWTSDAQDPYLSVTAHYIYAPPEAPNEWELQHKVIGYTEIEGSHSGANTAAVILRVVDRYDIRKKIGWATSDNASTNDRAMVVLQRVLDDPGGRHWIARKRRGRCMEHTIHLGAKSFIEAICPTPARLRKAKVSNVSESVPGNRKATVEDVEDESELLSEDDDWIYEDLPSPGNEVEVDDPVDFDPGDLLGKVLALVNQVCISFSI